MTPLSVAAYVEERMWSENPFIPSILALNCSLAQSPVPMLDITTLRYSTLRLNDEINLLPADECSAFGTSDLALRDRVSGLVGGVNFPSEAPPLATPLYLSGQTISGESDMGASQVIGPLGPDELANVCRSPTPVPIYAIMVRIHIPAVARPLTDLALNGVPGVTQADTANYGPLRILVYASTLNGKPLFLTAFVNLFTEDVTRPATVVFFLNTPVATTNQLVFGSQRFPSASLAAAPAGWGSTQVDVSSLALYQQGTSVAGNDIGGLPCLIPNALRVEAVTCKVTDIGRSGGRRSDVARGHARFTAMLANRFSTPGGTPPADDPRTTNDITPSGITPNNVRVTIPAATPSSGGTRAGTTGGTGVSSF